MNRLIVTIVLSCLCFASVAEPDMKKNILPRKEGMKWVYKAQIFDRGELFLSGTVTEEIVDKKIVEGVTCYKIKATFDYRSEREKKRGVAVKADDIEYYWEYLNEKGSHHLDGSDEDGNEQIPKKLSQFVLTVPYPVKKGDTFKAFGELAKVTAVDEEIMVMAGTFKCVVYESVHKEGAERDWSISRMYVAPGVGVVLLENEIRENGVWVIDMRDELMEFTK